MIIQSSPKNVDILICRCLLSVYNELFGFQRIQNFQKSFQRSKNCVISSLYQNENRPNFINAHMSLSFHCLTDFFSKEFLKLSVENCNRNTYIHCSRTISKYYVISFLLSIIASFLPKILFHATYFFSTCAKKQHWKVVIRRILLLFPFALFFSFPGWYSFVFFFIWKF